MNLPPKHCRAFRYRSNEATDARSRVRPIRTSKARTAQPRRAVRAPNSVAFLIARRQADAMRPELLRVEPSDETMIDAYHCVVAATRAHDLPDFPAVTRPRVAMWIRNPRPTIE